MNLYCASVCTIPERWDRTIWMVFGTSMSQSTPADVKSTGQNPEDLHPLPTTEYRRLRAMTTDRENNNNVRKLTFFPDHIYQHVNHYECSCSPNPCTAQRERKRERGLLGFSFIPHLFPLSGVYGVPVLFTCSALLLARRPVCSPASGWLPPGSRVHLRGQWARRGPARPWSDTATLCVLCSPKINRHRRRVRVSSPEWLNQS